MKTFMAAVYICAFLQLASCASEQSKPQPDTFCLNARQITLSKEDRLTKETLVAIIALDEKGEALCGWKPPKNPGGGK